MSSSALAAWPRPREIMVTFGLASFNSCANLRRILLRSIPVGHAEVSQAVSSLGSLSRCKPALTAGVVGDDTAAGE